MEEASCKIERHIDALDGVRALAIMLVAWFHVWEQDWLTPYIELDNTVTRYFGITESNIHTIVRFGFNAVEALIIVSAVVNFLPYARSIVFGEKWPDTRSFYKRRAIRIIPSYLLCVFIMFTSGVISGAYATHGGIRFAVKDLLSHLTFTSTFFPSVYRSAIITGALWTVQVEVIYYILLPFLARAFRRRPAITVFALCGVGMISGNILAYHASDPWGVNNFCTTFAGSYACGMLICMIYCTAKKAGMENRYTQIAGVLMMIGAVLCYNMIMEQFYEVSRPIGQLLKRFPIVLTISLFILGLLFSTEWIQKFFGNFIFKFICVISYNFYMWHQAIAVFLKNHRIPAWEGETPPNQLGDVVWSRKYSSIVWLTALTVSIVLTFGFERPISRYLSKKIKVR